MEEKRLKFLQNNENILRRMKCLGTIMKDSSNFWTTTLETMTSCKSDRESNLDDDEYCEIKQDIKEEYDTRSTLPKSEVDDNRIHNKNDDYEDNIIYSYAVNKIPLLNKKWTTEEEYMLISLVNSNRKQDWKKIATMLNKTSSQCSYRYGKIRNSIKRLKWSRKEDQQLLDLVEVYGDNWGYIQTKMNDKTVDDIRLRYMFKLKSKKVSNSSEEPSNNINTDSDLIASSKLSIDIDKLVITQNFDDEYNNIFVRHKRKDSYEVNFSDQFLVKNENTDLLKQYNLLENIFQQIYDFSNKYHNDVVDARFENKRQLLSLKLKQLKEDYLNIINYNVNNGELVQKSLVNQIELLIELINTIKIKIAMIQNGKII